MFRNLFSYTCLKIHLNVHMRTCTFQSKLFKYLQENHESNNDTQTKSENVETLRNILKMFDHYEGTKPGSLVSSKLYVESMKQIVEMQSCVKESLQKEDLVKILFYVGLQKKSTQAQNLIRLVLSRLNVHLDKFTLEDTCILANAVFKTSTRKLDQCLINHIRNTINSKFNTIIPDSAVLVCLIKIYRQYSIIDYELLNNLSSTTDVWAKKNFVVNAHILALFAEAKYHNEATLTILIQNGLHSLKNNPPPKNNHLLRAKDVARYLWAISVLQGKLTENDVQDVIWTWLHNQLILGIDFKKKPAVLLDSLLSLCILGYYSTELMTWLTSQETLYKLLDENKIQPWVKLKLLQTAVQIERPDLVFEAPLYNKFIPEQTVQQHLEQRPALKRLLTAITGLAEVLSLSATCKFQVPNLHIAGIVLYNHSDPVLHVELLDHSVCLHGTLIPTGIMQLKLRLLGVNSQHVLQLRKSEFPQDDAEFYVYLEDQLRRKLRHTYIT